MKTTEKRLKIRVSENVSSLVPYPPGKPIDELERELGIKGSIKLASNENPLGPSPKAIEAVRASAGDLHRYPDGSSYYLKRDLAAHLGVTPDMIVLGNGSNEVIELLMRALFNTGDEAVMGEPSFAVYPIVVKCMGGVSVRVPLTNDFKHDLPAMARAVTDRTRVIFIANPNNPTGTMVTAEEIERFLEMVPDDVVICMDEAYAEFVRSPGYPDSIGLLSRDRPILVLRTFSKVYGLAGLRVGYGVADPELAGYLERVRQPFNVNSAAQVAARAALGDAEHLEKTVANNAAGLTYLYAELTRMGFEFVETEANFFMIKVGDGKGVYDALLREGVIVRPMASYGLGEYIRVTVGLPGENERFVKALLKVTGRG